MFQELLATNKVPDLRCLYINAKSIRGLDDNFMEEALRELTQKDACWVCCLSTEKLLRAKWWFNY